MSTASRPMYAWQDVPWRKVERTVFKLQQRIYRASCRGDIKTVHKLQRLVLTSWYAKLLATRRVTQDNRGKRTAGVDGVKSLSPPKRLRLAYTLRLCPTAYPVRRVWVPKSGSPERRPIGTPSCRNGLAKPWSNSPWNRSGKRSSSPTATVFARDDHAMMRWKRFTRASRNRTNMSWMLTSKNASTA